MVKNVIDKVTVLPQHCVCVAGPVIEEMGVPRHRRWVRSPPESCEVVMLIASHRHAERAGHLVTAHLPHPR